MKLDQVRLALRVIAMILLGVIPATLLIVFLVVMLVFGGSAPRGVDSWLVAMIVLGILGVIGLWGGTFQNEQDRAFPPSVTVALLLCGLLAAPMLIDLAPSALEDGGLSAWFTIGPVGCALYLLVERAKRARPKHS